MIVGCPKEIKPQEGRVGLLPAGAAELVRNKHKVIIQKGAGELAGAPDAAYSAAGAELVEGAAEVFARADFVVKVKEPQREEYLLLRAGQVVFCCFHFARSRSLTQAMLQCEAVCLAYETVEELLLLQPKSEVAGRLAVFEGLHHDLLRLRAIVSLQPPFPGLLLLLLLLLLLAVRVCCCAAFVRRLQLRKPQQQPQQQQQQQQQQRPPAANSALLLCCSSRLVSPEPSEAQQTLPVPFASKLAR
ncbi:alanine dehydrogenase, putative [Eimeria necatrix]|uniref:Alanine dehydrogenase, putative n=1 Tax=Eimeria necatrix TaxID=51315 RepID=U6N0Y3_9EIME|nr:alanine dehydrogenase, putative [Eimeria necatrix]CDJ70113.1 alanine dehydrogenase, putative [Eimeria necatrix]